MASTVAGGIFNAFAFAGASWIFSKVDHGNYQAEQKRHDLAVERMQLPNNYGNEKKLNCEIRLQYRNWRLKMPINDLKSGIDALDQYHKLLKEQDTLHKYKDKIGDLSQYYQPSSEFQKYLTGVKIVIIGGVVYIGSKYIF